MDEVGSYEMDYGTWTGVKLYAPTQFWTAMAKDSGQCQEDWGCGPGKTGDRFVPDNIIFLDVWPCCGIHDLMYSLGKDGQDKDIADGVFRMNMRSLIDAKSNWLTRKIRQAIADWYYDAVHVGGMRSFEHKT